MAPIFNISNRNAYCLDLIRVLDQNLTQVYSQFYFQKPITVYFGTKFKL